MVNVSVGNTRRARAGRNNTACLDMLGFGATTTTRSNRFWKTRHAIRVITNNDKEECSDSTSSIHNTPSKDPISVYLTPTATSSVLPWKLKRRATLAAVSATPTARRPTSSRKLGRRCAL